MPETASSTQFDALRAAFAQGGMQAAFAQLTEQFIAEKRYHELFDLRMLEARQRLGLSLFVPKNVDELQEPLQSQLEAAQLGACREVGELFLAARLIPEAWMYLRVVGARPAVAAALDELDPDEEDLDQLIEIALQQGVSPRRGMEWILESYGTCTGITMFDRELAQLMPAHREEVARLLVRHLHAELTSSLVAEISRQEGSDPTEKTIAELVADRDWLFLENSYHIDTSHLSSTVRFARWITAADELRLAVDLTEYGRRLSAQYQYESEEPFANLYEDHARFFRTQLGTEPAGLEYFRQKIDGCPPETCGFLPAETYIVLLTRLGKFREAMLVHAEKIPAVVGTSGFAPTLVELAEKSRAAIEYQKICEERSDRVGFLAALLQG